MSEYQIALAAVASPWGPDPQDYRLDDMSALFPWIRNHRVYLAQHADFRRLTIVVPSSGAALVFAPNASLDDNRKLLNRVLNGEHIPLPGGIERDTLAESLRFLLKGIGGFVGTPRFLGEQSRFLDVWLKRAEDRPDFERACAAPSLSETSRAWKLSFFFFNPRGGIERWQVEGDRREVLRIEEAVFRPDGTFTFPYA